MGDGQHAVRVRRRHQRPDGGRGQGGAAVPGGVFQVDLEVVRAVGCPGGDKCRRVLLAGHCGQARDEPGKGAFGGGGALGGGADVGDVVAAGGQRPALRGEVWVAEHVQLCGDPEGQRLAEGTDFAGVDVAVDQAGQQGRTAAVDDLGARRGTEAPADAGDGAPGQQDVAGRVQPLAVEDVRAADQRAGAARGHDVPSAESSPGWSPRAAVAAVRWRACCRLP